MDAEESQGRTSLKFQCTKFIGQETRINYQWRITRKVLHWNCIRLSVVRGKRTEEEELQRLNLYKKEVLGIVPSTILLKASLR